MEELVDILAFFLLILSVLWMHFRVMRLKITVRIESKAKLYRICLLDGIALLVVFIGYFSPHAFGALMQEDYIGEWITFYAFSLSGIIVLMHI